MLRVSIHSSDAMGIHAGNKFAQLDIAYAKQPPVADCAVDIAIRSVGEVQPDKVLNYPCRAEHGPRSPLGRGRPRAAVQAIPRDSEIC